MAASAQSATKKETDGRSKVMMARAGASTVVRSRCDAGREMRGNLRV